MTELLKNHLGGAWLAGAGEGSLLVDPVTAEPLVRVSNLRLDLHAGFRFARDRGGRALRDLTFGQRAELLAKIVGVLQSRRDRYYEIAQSNSGTTTSDSAVDIDGAIYTVGQYAKWGAALGDARLLADGDAVPLSKDGLFRTQHVRTPSHGLALFINAFNFPSWGLWEKAAPALLAGVPVVVKPATATAWLTQRMVQDIVEAGILPPGALNVVCGSAAGLLDALDPFDVVSFTGSAQTAALVRRHDAISLRSVRANIEADSLNSAVLLPDAVPGDASFEAFVKWRCTGDRSRVPASRRGSARRPRALARRVAIAASRCRVRCARRRRRARRCERGRAHRPGPALQAAAPVMAALSPAT